MLSPATPNIGENVDTVQITHEHGTRIGEMGQDGNVESAVAIQQRWGITRRYVH